MAAAAPISPPPPPPPPPLPHPLPLVPSTSTPTPATAGSWVLERCPPSSRCAESFTLPTITSTTIALSSSYLSTYFTLVTVCCLWTVLTQTLCLPMFHQHGTVAPWPGLLTQVPDVIERLTLLVLLGLSILLFTRHFPPSTPSSPPHSLSPPSSSPAASGT